MLEFLNETEGAKVTNALGVQNTVQMITFVLDNTSVESFRLPIYGIAEGMTWQEARAKAGIGWPVGPWFSFDHLVGKRE